MFWTEGRKGITGDKEAKEKEANDQGGRRDALIPDLPGEQNPREKKRRGELWGGKRGVRFWRGGKKKRKRNSEQNPTATTRKEGRQKNRITKIRRGGKKKKPCSGPGESEHWERVGRRAESGSLQGRMREEILM